MFILGCYFEIIIHALFRQVFTKTKLVKIIERKEHQRKKAEGTPSSDDVQYKKHDLCSNMSEEIAVCLICGKHDGKMHHLRTNKASQNIRNMAKVLEDTDLLEKLGSSDIIDEKLIYHKPCYADLYKQSKRVNIKINVRSDDEVRLYLKVLA